MTEQKQDAPEHDLIIDENWEEMEEMVKTLVNALSQKYDFSPVEALAFIMEELKNEENHKNEEYKNNIGIPEKKVEMKETSTTYALEYGKTRVHTIENIGFGNLPQSVVIDTYKDGRPFSHFIEPWLAMNYPQLKHIKGCKQYDFEDINDKNIQYDQKTFTKKGCKFMPSNMIGTGRKFDKDIFEKKAKKLIYIIVSNVNFPEIKVKFVRGEDLIVDYPTGMIPSKDAVKFFN